MRGRVGRRRTAQGRRGPDARLPRDQALAAGTPPWAHLQLPSRSQPGVNRQMGAPQSSPTTPGGSPGSFCLSCSPPHAMLASLPPNISLLLTQIPTQAMRLLPEQLWQGPQGAPWCSSSQDSELLMEGPGFSPWPGSEALHTTAKTCTHACPVASVLSDSGPTAAARQAPLSRRFPGKNAGVSCHALLQGTSRPGDRTCLHCRWIPYNWATRSPRKT